jgi:hypothetical protein
MDINRVNGLLGQVRVKLESLDPANLEEAELEMQVGAGYDTDGSTVEVAKKRLQHLLDKLSNGRSDSNRVRATGTR